jgi:transposase
MNSIAGVTVDGSESDSCCYRDSGAEPEIILRSRPHPEQGFRSCIGILGLAKRYDAERLDAACARALALGTRPVSWDST